jgi:hypothetical protein
MIEPKDDPQAAIKLALRLGLSDEQLAATLPLRHRNEKLSSAGSMRISAPNCPQAKTKGHSNKGAAGGPRGQRHLLSHVPRGCWHCERTHSLILVRRSLSTGCQGSVAVLSPHWPMHAFHALMQPA